MLEKTKQRELEILAVKLRKMALDTIHGANSGHVGGSLSAMEILVTLYFDQLRVDPKNPRWPERDRFVLSKGHCTPALYPVLAQKGFFPVEELKGFRQLSSNLSGHAEMNKVPGVDFSTGSLGQGLAAAAGMALAARLDKKDYRVYAVLGDGETQEGEVWETAMAAANFKLSNLVAIVDKNRIQLDGPVEEIMNIDPLDEKFKAFGWNVITVDGHDIGALWAAFEDAKKSGKPTAIMANTVKGRGVSFMENNCAWHGKPPSDEQYDLAIKELDEQLSGLGA